MVLRTWICIKKQHHMTLHSNVHEKIYRFSDHAYFHLVSRESTYWESSVFWGRWNWSIIVLVHDTNRAQQLRFQYLNLIRPSGHPPTLDLKLASDSITNQLPVSCNFLPFSKLLQAAFKSHRRRQRRCKGSGWEPSCCWIGLLMV